MQPDAEGFLYPVVDASLCIECGLCEKVCPVLHRYGAPEPASVRAYACCNRDEPVRMASSSGGVFSLLSGEVLDKGGVVFGARFDHDFSVVHDSVEEIAGLGTLRGSKYTQSRIEGSFRRAESLLKAGREVLFVGTSCQIAGLKRFLGRPYANLLAVDVLCHGVPSPKVYAQYFAQQTRRVNAEAQPATEPYRLAHLEFRNKEERGWGRYCIVSEYVRTNGGESQQLRLAVPFTHEMFMRGFLHNLYLRPSCHECPARRLAAGSDLTIADYWGVEEHHPEMNDNKGTSLVIPLSDRQGVCRSFGVVENDRNAASRGIARQSVPDAFGQAAPEPGPFFCRVRTCGRPARLDLPPDPAHAARTYAPQTPGRVTSHRIGAVDLPAVRRMAEEVDDS